MAHETSRMLRNNGGIGRRQILRMAAGIAALALPHPVLAQSGATPYAGAVLVKRFTPTGSGGYDGSGWDDAMPLGWLGKSLALAEPGTALLIGVDRAAGQVATFGRDKQAFVKVSGTADQPLLILAGMPSGASELTMTDSDDAAPAFVGSPAWTRETYGKQKGAPCFLALERGVSNIVVAGFSFASSSGDGFIKFRIGKGNPATFGAIRIGGLSGQMVGRAIETDRGASIDGLVIEDCRATGIARGFARFRNLKHATLRRLHLDADHLDFGVKDPCQLIAIEKGDDILIEDVTLLNAVSSKEGHYTQGDGVVCERGTSNLTLRRCHGAGMGDAAFDLKTDNVTMEGCSTEDCKFGARLWTHSRNQIRDCSFKNPVSRGDTRGACVQASGNLEIVNSTFQAGKDTTALALHTLKGGKPPVVRMTGGAVQLDDGAALASANGKATLELSDVVVNGETRSGTFELEREPLR